MLLSRLFIIMTMSLIACSVDQTSQFSSTSQRATKEVVVIDDGQVGNDSDGSVAGPSQGLAMNLTVLMCLMRVVNLVALAQV